VSECAQGSGLERIVRVRGAYDKRDPDPSKNYGIHGMDLLFILKGPLGAVQFLVFTPMHLPHVQEELWRNNRHRDWNPFKPMGADIGYHAPHAQYEGQSPMKCDLMPSGECYYDGTGLGAEEFMPTFLSEGSDAVWTMLEQRYAQWFQEQNSK
jgi:hypothetical protein